MLTENITQKRINLEPFTFQVAAKQELNPMDAELESCLSPGTPWGDRQVTAKMLGYKRCQEAVPALVQALPADNFWMVRCAIIQALEMIGDTAAIPVLRETAKNDAFQVVRAYAVKAIERILLNNH